MKPKSKIIGENGNIFNLTAIARKALVLNEQREEAEKCVMKSLPVDLMKKHF
jgi:hypothetical protein